MILFIALADTAGFDGKSIMIGEGLVFGVEDRRFADDALKHRRA
jgi:hypothetical protein